MDIIDSIEKVLTMTRRGIDAIKGGDLSAENVALRERLLLIRQELIKVKELALAA